MVARDRARTRDYPPAVARSKYIAPRDQSCMVTSVGFSRSAVISDALRAPESPLQVLTRSCTLTCSCSWPIDHVDEHEHVNVNVLVNVESPYARLGGSRCPDAVVLPRSSPWPNLLARAGGLRRRTDLRAAVVRRPLQPVSEARRVHEGALVHREPLRRGSLGDRSHVRRRARVDRRARSALALHGPGGVRPPQEGDRG